MVRVFPPETEEPVFFIAYNGATSDVTKTRPDWERLRDQFMSIILEAPFDYKTQLAFGIL